MRRMMIFMAGTFCGALVGAVAALLLAPVSGEELRSQIRGRYQGLVEDVRQAYQSRRAQLEAELEALRSPRTPA
ncbi:MAG: YtxH domain-containing protein [Chloroflexota bacterium]